MFNIKKQITNLYMSSIWGQISLSGAWVAILAARGFSLLEIGFAETIFHIVSLIFEIPSGVVADVFGRKKTLILSCLFRIAGDIVMVLSNNFAMVCLSIALHALSYNFSSGSGDALAFDSLKSVEKEEGFERYASRQMIIYRTCEGLSTLCAGFALVIGYKAAYISGVVCACVQLFYLSRLVEVRVSEENGADEKEAFSKALHKKMISCFKESLEFLRTAKRAVALMFANSFVGAIDILLLFFLQAKLPQAGIPNWALGLALLAMQFGGIIGAKIILFVQKAAYKKIFSVATIGILCGIIMEGSGLYLVMTAGGFLAALADDALQVRTNFLLQKMFPSEQRATLISIESFTFSVIMLVLSPLAGLFFAWW